MEQSGGTKSLCSTLERLLAWEKKLYQEVKVVICCISLSSLVCLFLDLILLLCEVLILLLVFVNCWCTDNKCRLEKELKSSMRGSYQHFRLRSTAVKRKPNWTKQRPQ